MLFSGLGDHFEWLRGYPDASVVTSISDGSETSDGYANNYVPIRLCIKNMSFATSFVASALLL